MLENLLATYGIYSPKFPEIAGSYQGKGLVICGDGSCLWDDLERFGCRDDSEGGKIAKPGWDFMVINAAGCKFPGVIEHWFSNDGNLVDGFRSVRRQEYPRSFKIVHEHGIFVEPGQWASPHPNTWMWPWPGRGTSGCGAVLTGLALGYDRIVGCGIPLDNSPHNGEPPWRKTNFVNEVRDDVKHWLRIADLFSGRVTFMSGKPREWFGWPVSSDGRTNMTQSMSPSSNLASQD